MELPWFRGTRSRRGSRGAHPLLGGDRDSWRAILAFLGAGGPGDSLALMETFPPGRVQVRSAPALGEQEVAAVPAQHGGHPAALQALPGTGNASPWESGTGSNAPSERQSAPSALRTPKDSVMTFCLRARTDPAVPRWVPAAPWQSCRVGNSREPGDLMLFFLPIASPPLPTLFPEFSTVPTGHLLRVAAAHRGSVGGAAAADLCHQTPAPRKPRERHLFRHTKSMLSYIPKPLHVRQAICLR